MCLTMNKYVHYNLKTLFVVKEFLHILLFNFIQVIKFSNKMFLVKINSTNFNTNRKINYFDSEIKKHT